MKTQHSLISPSNFERRMLCPGSLNAEKDLPETTSIYAQVGTMLHERTALYIEYLNTRKDKKLPQSHAQSSRRALYDYCDSRWRCDSAWQKNRARKCFQVRENAKATTPRQLICLFISFYK